MSFVLPIVLSLLVAASQLVDNPEDLGKTFARAQRLLASGDFDGARAAYEALLAVEDQTLLQASKVRVVVDEEAVGLQAAARYQLANLERRRAKLLREEAELAGPETGDSLEALSLRSLRLAAQGFAELRDDPGFELSERAAYMVLDCLFEAHDHEGVTEAGEALLALYPTGKYALRARYTMGWSYYELQRYAECVAVFAAFLEDRPEGIQADRARLQMGLAQEALGQLPEALQAFTVLAQAYDPATMSYEEKTQVALAGLREGTSRRSIAAKAWLKRGDVLKAQGDAAGALEAYRRVPEGFPEEERLAEMAWIRQALVAGAAEGPERAAEVYRHAVEASPRPGFRARMLAGEMSAWFDAGRYAEALEGHRAYLKALLGDGGRAAGQVLALESGVSVEEAWFRVGECLRLLADSSLAEVADSLRAEAVTAYTRGLALAPGPETTAATDPAEATASLEPDALFWRGLQLEQLGETDSAAADYGRARSRFPGTEVACEATLRLARLQQDTAVAVSEELLQEMLSTCGDEGVRGLAALELGRLYQAEKRLDEAQAVLAGVTVSNPHRARARLELSQVLLREGQVKAAREVLGEALEQYGRAPLQAEQVAIVGRMQAQLGLIHQRYGEHEQALALLGRGLAMVDPRARANIRFGIGWSLYELHRYEDAWQEWEATLQEEELTTEAQASLLRGLGLCAEVLGRTEQAARLFARVAADQGSEAEGRLALGQLHLDGERPASTLAVLEPLLSGDVAPGAALRARLLAAKASLAQGRFEETLELIEQIRAPAVIDTAAPPLPAELATDLAYTEGSAALGLNRYAEAAAAFERSAATATQASVQAEALFYQAQSLWGGGDPSAARQVLARLADDFAQQPRAAEAAFTVAELDYGEGFYESAGGWYRRVVDEWPRSPRVPEALYGAAWARLELDDVAGMDSLFTALADRYPEDERAPGGLMSRADYYYNQQDYESAAAAYGEVVARYPDSPEAQDAHGLLAYLRDREADQGYQAAMALYDAEDYEAAIVALSRVVEAFPGTASEAAARCNIGMAYQHMAEYRRALETYDEAVAALEGREDAGEALAFARDNMAWIRTNVLGEAVP